MNEQKLKGLVGLAVRAGQAASGMDASRILIRSGKCGVLLLDSAAGANTRKKAEDLCRSTGTPLTVLPENLIEAATGKSNMMVAVSKGSFAEEIIKNSESTDLP